jgi:hypothetical protein
MDETTIVWVAYCTDCQEELEAGTNGSGIEEVAERHAALAGHRVLVGYYVDADEEESPPIVA